MKPAFTLEDGTRVLETTGDADALDYGGGVLYRIGNSCWWEFWDRPEKNYFVYTADASRGVLDRYNVDLDELALSAAGEISKKELVKLSDHANPRARLQLLQLIRNGYGASHLDRDGPKEVTKFELASQWGFLFGIDKGILQEISPEDYIIRDAGGRLEAGRVDGVFLGRHSRYDHALSAVADDMKKVGLFTNLFHEHSPGQIELIQWDPQDYVGRRPIVRGKMPTAQWKLAMRRYNPNRMPTSRRKKSITQLRKSEAMRVAQHKRIERARKIRDYLRQ